MSKKELIKRYKRRIKNFYKILKTNKKIYFIYSNIWLTREYPTSADICELYNAIKTKRNKKDFELILIIPKKIKCINNPQIHQIIIKDFPIDGPKWAEDFLNAETENKVYSEKNKNLYFFLKKELNHLIK